MGTELPPQEDYELSGKSLWPYLTKKADQHREWIYGFKGHRQLARGHQLMRDGNGKWWDVSRIPKNLDNFPPITDFEVLTAAQRAEKKTLEEVMASYAREDIGGPHSFHADPSRKISKREIEKMRAKAAAREKHFKKAKN